MYNRLLEIILEMSLPIMTVVGVINEFGGRAIYRI